MRRSAIRIAPVPGRLGRIQHTLPPSADFTGHRLVL